MSGLTLSMVKAQDRKVGMGMGRGVTMVSKQEIQQALADQMQVFGEMVT